MVASARSPGLTPYALDASAFVSSDETERGVTVGLFFSVGGRKGGGFKQIRWFYRVFFEWSDGQN